MSIVPTDADALFGRGRMTNAHPGNVALRAMVDDQKPTFQRAKRMEKRNVARAIIEDFQKQGGRFLMEDGSDGEGTVLERRWVLAEEEKVVGKVMHLLRERDKKAVAEALSNADDRARMGPSLPQTPSFLGVGTEIGPTPSLAVGMAGVGAAHPNILAGILGELHVQQQQQQQQQFVGSGHVQFRPELFQSTRQSTSIDPRGPAAAASGAAHTPLGHRLSSASGGSASSAAPVAPAATSPSLPSAPSIVPTDNDVLFGRGPAINAHSGNVQLRTMANKHKRRFQDTNDRQEKRRIAIGIVDECLRSGGRFLAEDPDRAESESGKAKKVQERQWIVAERDGAIKKVMHILREKDRGNEEEATSGLVPLVQPVGWDRTAFLSGQLARPSTGASLDAGVAHFLSGTIAEQPINNLPFASDVAAGRLARHSSSARSLGNAANVALDASMAGPPVRIRDWMDAAKKMPSKNAYLLGAVELAWMLAKHLSDLIGSGAKMNVEDIAPNALLLFVERPLRQRGSDESHRNLPVIREVQFKPSLFGAERTVPRARDACAVLGRILSEAFGMDQTRLGKPLKRDGARDDGMLPPPKRQATTQFTGFEANDFLSGQAMPLSIRRLVRDLVCAGGEQQGSSEEFSSKALTTLEEALWEMGQMRSNPEAFLFEQTCPEKALDNFYCLDENLFGREKELAALTEKKTNVATFVGAKGNAISGTGSDFLCEAALVRGYAGSGKSTLLLPLFNACVKEQWFVLSCKFDKQTPPIKVLLKTFNDFFGKWGESERIDESFRNVCSRIFATIDDDGFDQLADLVPNFSRLFPLVAKRDNSPDHVGVSSMDKVGSAQMRLQKLIRVLVESICSAGRPMLFVLDDLQWSDPFVMDSVLDFVTYVHHHRNGPDAPSRRGLFLAGIYRSNEVTEDHPLIRSISHLKNSERANVTMLTTAGLSKTDVTKLISAKLCLPWRYTRDLAEVVQTKTRGNPFFIIQFLRTIVSNKMLEFSVRSRRWIWDCDVVEMQMISDGVAGLLAASFNQLPSQLTKTMEIVSCLGYQVDALAILSLDSTKEVLSFNMLDQMELAVKEGILERAGPVYQFTHDILQQTIYELIPSDSRGLLHKIIGRSLLKSAASDPATHLLAVEQINMFCKDSTPDPEERSQFAISNSMAAKFALADSSFERARSYIDMGIQLLEADHWVRQYPLSLELYEMSASVSCISGDITTMSTCLTAVLSHVLTFEDSLKASSMLVKLLASNSKYEEARSNCLDILKKLGEDFPSEISLPLVQKELPELLLILRNITYDRIKQLSPMTDRSKLNAMKFLNMLCMYCMVSMPLLLPFLTHRMVQLTLEHGFCEDSIVGLATAGFSVYSFTEDFRLAFHLGKVSELLVEESPKKHILRARLCNELYVTLKLLREPWPSVVAMMPELYNSAMLAGDIENALICRWMHSAGGYWLGAMRLSTTSEQLVLCIKEAAKYQQNMVLYNTMAMFQSCMHISGTSINVDVEIKSLDELHDIGIETNSNLLIVQVFMYKLSNLFWSRAFLAVAELAEKHSAKHDYSALQQKRVLHIFRIFYEGTAYLNLARGSGDAKKKWREMGEKAVATMTGYATSMSQWIFENKSLLLQAELHYLNGDLDPAAAMYEASIKSACEHKFIHEEALAYELHGRFCVENQMAEKGSNQLRVAVSKYNEWGSTKKANDLQLYLDTINDADIK